MLKSQGLTVGSITVRVRFCEFMVTLAPMGIAALNSPCPEDRLLIIGLPRGTRNSLMS
jgi:hypothetical protein